VQRSMVAVSGTTARASRTTGYRPRMDGVGWDGTAAIFAPVFATVAVAALIVALAMRREKSKRRKD
jgi:hypothetical protein